MCPAGGLTTTRAVYIHRVVRADAIQWSVHMKQPGVTTGAFLLYYLCSTYTVKLVAQYFREFRD